MNMRGNGTVYTEGRDLNVTTGSCTSTPECNIENPDASPESCTVQAPQTEGNYTYYACTGQNQVNQNEAGTLAEVEVTPSSQNGNANVSGYVKDESGNAIVNARVETFYPPGGPYPGTNDVTFTNAAGYYEFQPFIGDYVIKFSKDNYFAEEKDVSLACNDQRELNATLMEGSCNAQCYNWEGRCNADCANKTFETGNCTFYDAKAREKVDGRPYESWVQYNYSGGDTFYYVKACEGVPFEVTQPLASVDGPIEELYKRERIVKSSQTGQPVKLVVNVWENR